MVNGFFYISLTCPFELRCILLLQFSMSVPSIILHLQWLQISIYPTSFNLELQHNSCLLVCISLNIPLHFVTLVIVSWSRLKAVFKGFSVIHLITQVYLILNMSSLSCLRLMLYQFKDLYIYIYISQSGQAQTPATTWLQRKIWALVFEGVRSIKCKLLILLYI